MGSFVRRVKTASGATAVQIMHKKGREVIGIDHIGSAHNEAELEWLLSEAQDRLHAGEQMLDFKDPEEPEAVEFGGPAKPMVTATGSLVLWDALVGLYDALGFGQIKDDAFKALVLGRIIEPTSKADTVRVLTEIGVKSPTRVTFMRCLKRVIERDYRDTISAACYAHATTGGGLAMVLYDLTTLHFETDKEDNLRKVGMSKERRVDPQVTVGLLTDTSGFPLQIHLFEGNKAETKTLIPVLTQFKERHGSAEVIVVADAGMLSAANLLALEDAGFRFIVGSRAAKTPYDLAEHLERHGDYFTNGQVIETTRDMGTGAQKRIRRVVYQYRFKRSQHDNKAINAMIARAEDIASGQRPLKRDRFVRIDGAKKGVDWALVERARSMMGLKGYVTNIDTAAMAGADVIQAYQDLYQVERSFRMTKSDLAARPIFHRVRDSIEAHLSVVFAALAISREAQKRTGLSIKKVLTTLRPLRSATITIGRQQLTAPPQIPADAQRVLKDLAKSGH